jgi:hypothetical protein
MKEAVFRNDVESGAPAPDECVAQPERETASAHEKGAAVGSPPLMDRDFIARNEIIERYLSGKLPVKGAVDFERFCREDPALLDEIGLPQRINAGLRLLEASGKPEPWQQTPTKFWQRPYVAIGLGAAVLLLAGAIVVLSSANADKTRRIAHLQGVIAAQPLAPVSTTRTIHLMPSRIGSSDSPVASIDGAAALADLHFDMTHSPYRAFRMTIDRMGQGRVAVIHNIMKDSNGQLHVAFNSSTLGPGIYQFALDGLTWRGDAEPDSWTTIAIQH